MGYKKQMMKLFNSGGAATASSPSSQRGGAPVPHHQRHPRTSEEAAAAPGRSNCPTAASTISNGSDSASGMGMGRQDSLDPLLARGWLRSMPNLASFDARSLHAATGGFSPENVLGEGGFGRVYRGKLADGRLVAVKRLDRRGLQGDEEFMTEVSSLNNLRHPNIIRLHGVCVEDKQRMCVFQLGESSLRRRLDGDCPGRPPLTWPERIRVLLGVARGLVYLHEGTTPQIVHSDVTSNNVLLLEDGSSSLADFGLARDLPKGSVTLSEVRSAFGYIAPELAAKGTLSPKADSFSFGVLALEVLTGLHPIDTSRPKGQHDLVEWLRPMLHDPPSIAALLDPRLPGGRGAFPLPQLSAVCEVASGCLRADPDARLQMSDALDLLRPACKGAPQPAVATPAAFSAPSAAPGSTGARMPIPSRPAPPAPAPRAAPRAAAAPCTPQRSPPAALADLIAGFSSPAAPAMPVPQSGWNPFSPPPPPSSSSSAAAAPPQPQEQQSSMDLLFGDEAASGGQQWWRAAPNPFLAASPGAAACAPQAPKPPAKAAAPYAYEYRGGGGGAAHGPGLAQQPAPGRDPFAALPQLSLPLNRAPQQQQQLQEQQQKQQQIQRQQQQLQQQFQQLQQQLGPSKELRPPVTSSSSSDEQLRRRQQQQQDGAPSGAAATAPGTAAAPRGDSGSSTSSRRAGRAAAPAAPPASAPMQLDTLCVVCMSSRRDHQLSPCGHAATCSSCAMVLSAVSGPCPVCSTPVAAASPSSTLRSLPRQPQQQQQPQPQQQGHQAVLNYSQASYNPYVAGVC